MSDPQEQALSITPPAVVEADIVAPGESRMTIHRERSLLSRECILAILLTASMSLSLLAGCTLPSRSIVSFESLCGLTLEEFETMDEEVLVRWVERTFGTPPERLDTGPGDLPGVTYRWRESQSDRYAYVRDGLLVEISSNLEAGPSLGEVVDSLDTPMAVVGGLMIAYDAHPGYSVELDYPTKGLSVVASSWKDHSSMVHSGESYWEDWTVTLNEGMRVNLVVCYRPRASIEDVWRDDYQFSEETVRTRVERQGPWPGFGARIPLR